jgi:hypothetical protein
MLRGSKLGEIQFHVRLFTKCKKSLIERRYPRSTITDSGERNQHKDNSWDGTMGAAIEVLLKLPTPGSRQESRRGKQGCIALVAVTRERLRHECTAKQRGGEPGNSRQLYFWLMVEAKEKVSWAIVFDTVSYSSTISIQVVVI